MDFNLDQMFLVSVILQGATVAAILFGVHSICNEIRNKK